MEDNTLVKSSFSATINAPIEKVDISPGALRYRIRNTSLAPQLTKPISEGHNRLEMPHYAKSIERHALRRK
jgi:hypothetical protein